MSTVKQVSFEWPIFIDYIFVWPMYGAFVDDQSQLIIEITNAMLKISLLP